MIHPPGRFHAPVTSSRARRRDLGRLVAILGAVSVAVLAGCGAPAGGPSAGAGGGAGSRPRVWHPPKADTLGPVVAIVGDHYITRHAVDSLLSKATPQLQQDYRTSADRYRLVVERLVNNEALHQAALRDSVQLDSAYRAEVEGYAYDTLLRYYFQRQVHRAPQPSDSAIEAIYNEHSKDFDVPGRARVHHILYRTEAQAKAARRRLEAGATWADVCRKESRDSLTSKNEGVLGYITTDSDLVPGLGSVPEFVKAALALKPGEISRPLKTSRGWHLVMVDDRTEPSHTPLSEVRDRIAGQLAGPLQDQFAHSLIDSLKQISGATIFDDSIRLAIRPPGTPQELFEKAQAAATPRDRIALFRDLVAKYPKERVSEQAAFMIGFTYAEELDDYASARTAFEEFLRTHPKSDLAQSAKWMLENMDKPNPPFEGEAPADSAGSREGK